MSDPTALFDPAATRLVEQACAMDPGDARADLMERAGQAAWRQLQQRWPQAQRVLVVCGTGDNGGDGWVVAQLARQAGCQVQVVSAGVPRSARALAAQRGYLQAGGHCLDAEAPLADADVLVDGLLGLGLSRAPQGSLARLIEAINASGLPVLALDVPSGVDAGTGAVPGVAVHASVTVQFLHAHAGLYTGAALEHVGARVVAGLGQAEDRVHGVAPVAQLLDAPALRGLLRPRRRNAHKGDNGHVLCVGGNHAMGGAVLLAGLAALRSGAGLVSVATRAPHVPAMLAHCPELMAHACERGDDLLPLLQRCKVLALGPGLGQDDWARALFAVACGLSIPRVLDADALNLLAGAPQPLPGAVLTPHPGEAARLLGWTARAVQAERYRALAALVQRYACTVVLKGAGSLVGSPGQGIAVIGAGNPGMAVGGMGDLLTGVIAALLAQGLPAFDAARCGALLHAAAGDAAAGNSPRGLIPSDLLPHLRVLANPDS